MGLIPDEIPEKDQHIAKEYFDETSIKQNPDEPSLHQCEARITIVEQACELLAKGFVPESYILSSGANPIATVADWIEDACIPKSADKPTQPSKQDFKEKQSALLGILSDVNKTANRADRHIKDFQIEIKPQLKRNTALNNLLILCILPTAEGTLLDDIGKILDIPRLSPESDRSYPESDQSYRERLKQALQ